MLKFNCCWSSKLPETCCTLTDAGAEFAFEQHGAIRQGGEGEAVGGAAKGELDAKAFAGDGPNPVDRAAWTSLARALFNLDETVNRN